MVCEAQPVTHCDEQNGFCHLPTAGKAPTGAARQGRPVSDPKAHRVGLLLRETYLHCHTSDVTTRQWQQGGSPALRVPFGKGQGWAVLELPLHNGAELVVWGALRRRRRGWGSATHPT